MPQQINEQSAPKGRISEENEVLMIISLLIPYLAFMYMTTNRAGKKGQSLSARLICLV